VSKVQKDRLLTRAARWTPRVTEPRPLREPVSTQAATRSLSEIDCRLMPGDRTFS
jgi:hypothetical protein